MSKMKYIQPQMEVKPVVADAHVMLLNSDSGPQPAPQRMDVAPNVPGDPL